MSEHPNDTVFRGDGGVSHAPARQTHIVPASRPQLVAGARLQTDRVTGKPVLLFPEGVLQLNDSGAAILILCDGRRTVADIVAALAARYSAPPDLLSGDVIEYLHQLSDRRYIRCERERNIDVTGSGTEA